MKTFESKVAIVTGAASGMGEAIVKQLADYGAKVIATDINEEKLGQTFLNHTNANNISCKFLDVSDREAFEKLIKDTATEYGQLDYLFNNAGIAFVGEVAESTLDQWQALVNVNQMGLVYGTLTAYEVMRKQGNGHIVNTASIAGLMPAPMMAAYCMTKHAVAGMSLSLREEAALYGVNVSIVCPGIIKTNIVDNFDMSRLSKRTKDPFEYFEKVTSIKALPADKAADYILKGVNKNLAEIVFPLHGKLMVNFYHYMRKVWQLGTANTLKQMRPKKIKA